MTTELEKQFFDTFGIEPYREPSREYNLDGEICSWYIEYPQISDRHYLKLFMLYSSIQNFSMCYDNLDSFKEAILEEFIENSEDFNKHQVPAIFEGD